MTYVIIDSTLTVIAVTIAVLVCRWIDRRFKSNERVLTALVDQLQHSDCDAFRSEPVTNGRVVSLERTPASRTSAVPRPAGGRPFSVAQSRPRPHGVGPRGRA